MTVMVRPMRTIQALVPAVTLALVLPLLAGASSPAVADSPAGQVVSERPSTATPHVLDGRVLSVVEVGDTMVLGGTFTRARNADNATEVSRSRLLAFDAASGRLSTTFLPQPNGTVNVVVPAGDGTSVYVGGSFTSIGGAARKNLARVRLSDGAVLPDFNTGAISGAVRDLRLSGGRLWVAGAFTHLGGRAQTALATVDPTTGRVTDYMALPVRGTHNGGATNITKIDVTPDGSQLVGVGNFDTVGGVQRRQMMVLDTTGPSAAVGFGTQFYRGECASVFDTYMRDVDVSPDGSFFVVSTTGAHRGATSPCDTTARFETASTGDAAVPSWIDTTGGDTTYAVEVTGSAVYTGGHARWQNNPYAGDRAGQGAVARPGIAALDPVNGLPLSWNPGRARGVGVFDMHVTDRGLYVASDTDRIGANYYRARIALMPAAGATFPAVKRPQLPDDVHLLGSTPGGAATVTARRFDGGPVTAADRAVGAGGTDWTQMTGGFMVNGQLYAGWRDGSFTRQSYDGTTFGPRTAVDGSDLLVRLDVWHNEVDDLTGLFFDHGRIYYTLAGSSELYYRYFTPESGVVGALRYTASPAVGGFDPAAVRGTFLAGQDLYWADAAGVLRRTPWNDGAVSGTPRADATTVVSGPGVDGRSWAARALVAYQDPSGNGADGAPNLAPAAAFSVECVALTCSVDGTGSEDPDGDVVSYAWEFGDGTTATGPTAEHTYTTPGSYDVRLTVRDDDGATATTTRTAEAAEAPDVAVEQVATTGRSGSGRAHDVTVPAAVQAGDTLLLFLTLNSTEGALTPPPGWTLLEQGDAGKFRSRAWVRTAGPGDAGSTVRVATDLVLKSDLTLGAYRSTGGGSQVSDSAVAVTTGAAAQHTSPAVAVADPGSWLVTYWGEKSAGTTTWTAPAGQVERRQGSSDAGGGSVSGLTVDSGSAVATGAAGGLVARTDHDVARTATYSVVLSAG